MFVSVIMFLMGVITCVFGGMQMGAIPGADSSFMQNKIPDMSRFGMGIIILGIICVVTGILGCLTGKCKKCWFATLFIILSGIVGLICLILGFIMMGGAGLVSRAVDLVCSGVRD
jgi:hypothetical protein